MNSAEFAASSLARELQSLRSAHNALAVENRSLRAAILSAIDWRGLDGDGITEPTLTTLREALCLPPAGGNHERSTTD